MLHVDLTQPQVRDHERHALAHISCDRCGLECGVQKFYHCPNGFD